MGLHSGRSLRILCVGRIKRLQYQLVKALGENINEAQICQMALWRVPRWIDEKNGADCDLLLAAVPQWNWNRLRGPDTFIIPDWVIGEVCLKTLMTIRPNHSRAQDLRLIKKYELQPGVVEHPRNIRMFYDTMHVPLIYSSHGSLAVQVPYPRMAKRFRTSDLMFVMKEDEPIAGMGIDFATTPPTLFALGIKKPIDTHRKMGVVAASYHFALERLANQGYATASVGLSRPFLDDGVLQYKRKFGTCITGCHDQYTLLRILNRSESLEAFLVNSPFIHRTFSDPHTHGLTGAVFVANGTLLSEVSRRDIIAHYALDGLDGLFLHQQGVPPHLLSR